MIIKMYYNGELWKQFVCSGLYDFRDKLDNAISAYNRLENKGELYYQILPLTVID